MALSPDTTTLGSEESQYLNEGGTLTNGSIPTMQAPTGQAITAIPADELGNPKLTPPTIPNVPIPSDLTSLNTSGNSAISGNTAALTPPETSTDDMSSDTTDATPTWYQRALAAIQPSSATQTETTDENQANISGLTKNVNTDQEAVNTANTNLANLNAQLKVYSDNAQAIPIADQANATGRGITAAGLAPVDSANLRNNALAAIPLQAQVLAAQASVASAQGNATLAQSILTQAQDHVDKLFSLQSTDAANQYNYNKSIIDSYYNYATSQQQAQLDALKTTQANAFTRSQSLLSDANDLAKTAISNGAATIAGKIMALDPKSPTYETDLGKLASQIPATKVVANWSAPVMINGKLTQTNSATGEVRTVAGGSATAFGKPTATDMSTLQSVILKQPASVQSTINQTALTTDPTYFWWVQGQLNQ